MSGKKELPPITFSGRIVSTLPKNRWSKVKFLFFLECSGIKPKYQRDRSLAPYAEGVIIKNRVYNLIHLNPECYIGDKGETEILTSHVTIWNILKTLYI